MPDPGIPQPDMTGATTPPWAALGAQLIEAVLQRLNSDAGGEPMAVPPREREPFRRPAHYADDRLERSYRLLSRRNAHLARALGACRCWGLSPDCPRCGGRGQAGAFDVDPAAFEAVLLPLLQAQPELIVRHLTRAVEAVPEQ